MHVHEISLSPRRFDLLMTIELSLWILYLNWNYYKYEFIVFAISFAHNIYNIEII